MGKPSSDNHPDLFRPPFEVIGYDPFDSNAQAGMMGDRLEEGAGALLFSLGRVREKATREASAQETRTNSQPTPRLFDWPVRLPMIRLGRFNDRWRRNAAISSAT